MQSRPLKELVLSYDEDESKIKLARYAGDVIEVQLFKGCASVGTLSYFVSDNFPDGTILSINVVDSRTDGVYPSLLVRDIVKLGKNDLSDMPFAARFELLDLLCSSFTGYGFEMFGGRCIAPYVYAATPLTFTLADKCEDERFMGITVFSSEGHENISITEEHSDVDSVTRFPPVPNEGERVLKYKSLVQSMIKKMCGKWKDAYMKRHTPGQLPHSADDLMQQGLMEVMIAIRKFDSTHASKAKESTFVYKHLWNRFGHIAHKYSKQSRGYGVTLMRDFTDEDGNMVSSYDNIASSSSYTAIPMRVLINSSAPGK